MRARLALVKKAGKKLDKRGESLTFFNYDNFGYFSTDNFGQSLVPPNTPNGYDAPFNAAAPLYQSSPFVMEVNPIQQAHLPETLTHTVSFLIIGPNLS